MKVLIISEDQENVANIDLQYIKIILCMYIEMGVPFTFDGEELKIIDSKYNIENLINTKKLTSLVGLPSGFNSELDCTYNKLTSLEGI